MGVDRPGADDDSRLWPHNRFSRRGVCASATLANALDDPRACRRGRVHASFRWWSRSAPTARWRLSAAVNSPRPGFPVAVSLGAAHLLIGGWLASRVSHPAQAFAFELAEPDAVGGVGVIEVEDGPRGLRASGPIRLTRPSLVPCECLAQPGPRRCICLQAAALDSGPIDSSPRRDSYEATALHHGRSGRMKLRS
jgi:hypothetical protein